MHPLVLARAKVASFLPRKYHHLNRHPPAPGFPFKGPYPRFACPGLGETTALSMVEHQRQPGAADCRKSRVRHPRTAPSMDRADRYRRFEPASPGH